MTIEALPAADDAPSGQAASPRRERLRLMHGDLTLPAYLPDATFGVVRAVDAADLEAVGIDALVMNVFHLMQKPGSSTIGALGGLHRMACWPHTIVTDSGGFQAYSLIRQNPKFGRLTNRGIRFKPEGSEREFHLTPEKSVQLQMAYGADIVICLDDCTHVDASREEQEISVERTVKWAARCKEEFVRQMSHRNYNAGETMPLLFAVVQGGGDAARRHRCASQLLEIGFDGFGYGGWPLDSSGNLLVDMLSATRLAIPCEFPMHALGIGHPKSVAACYRMGYDIFDCALPTRDARTGRLYTFRCDPHVSDFQLDGDWFETLYIDDEKHTKVNRPIYPGCDCPACAQYSVGYLRHLHKCGDTLFYRLATLHNLRFMTLLMRLLRAGNSSAQIEGPGAESSLCTS